MKERLVYGVATISEKGQLAIPIMVRRELGLQKGDKMIVIKRKDNAGFTFIRMDLMDKLISKLGNDEAFFDRYLNKLP